MWLGLDDTDYLEGGCTTLEFHKLLEALPCPYSNPRLVRLWPFAAQRTRGNAALAVELHCNEEIIPFLDNYWKSVILPLRGAISISEHDDRFQHPTDPGMMLFSEQPNAEYYWRAVRQKVEDLPRAVKTWGGHGRIGASAACAWPANTQTWEAIAWRVKDRKVDQNALAEVDSWPETFLCRDPRSNRGLIAPRGPCPVMFGIRATREKVATDAAKLLIDAEGTAEIISYRTFSTNQASGDHIESTYSAIINEVSTIKGGHTIIETERGRLVSFSEGGEMNLLAQWLQPGDEIEYIGLEDSEKTVHLEGLKVLSSFSKERPTCSCGKRMKSMGKGQGVRCSNCKTTQEEQWIVTERTPPSNGWTQPPFDSRRHLAREIV